MMVSSCDCVQLLPLACATGASGGVLSSKLALLVTEYTIMKAVPVRTHCALKCHEPRAHTIFLAWPRTTHLLTHGRKLLRTRRVQDVLHTRRRHACTRAQVRPKKEVRKPAKPNCARAHHEDDVVIDQELLAVAVLCVEMEKRQTKVAANEAKESKSELGGAQRAPMVGSYSSMK
jgi:hypothetical protein